MSETRGRVRGFRLLRPFSHVIDRNPSLGSPSWYALEAVLVDQGWFARSNVGATTVRTRAEEQMFEEPVEISGVVRAASTVTDQAWHPLLGLSEQLGGPHYGRDLLTEVVLVVPAHQ